MVAEWFFFVCLFAFLVFTHKNRGREGEMFPVIGVSHY